MSNTMRTLATARPDRLTPDSPPSDPSMIMSYARSPEPRRTHTRRLVLAGAGLAAVAAVTAAVVLRPAGTPVQTPTVAAPTTAAVPGDLLLVAAQHTEARPATGGRYWVVRVVHGEGDRTVTDEQWLATRAGDPTVAYFRGPSGAWTVQPMEQHTPENNFLLAGQPRTVAELAALPTDPAALKAKLLAWNSGLEGDGFLFHSGAAIVLDLPVPAAVRAAAYRMLAALPGIETLGPVTDAAGRAGVAVAYSRRGDGGAVGQQRLVIDPASGAALAQESWTSGRRLSFTTVLRAEWVDGTPPAAADVE